MKIFQYKCTLLSNVVISSSSATEGGSQSLDYIPGSKFLGIVAGKLYNEEDDISTLDIFHNGNVSFGDAHPYLDNENTYKVPAKWFFPKGKSITDKIYLHPDQLDKATLATEQPKQARVGYITKTGKWLTIKQSFAIKSAYDSEQLRSRDAQMYGYFSLEKGTEWIFTVKDNTGYYAKSIRENLEGKKRIGRSRSAEYGLVDITFLGEVSAQERSINNDKTAYIYAESNLCFYNEYALNTAKPSESSLNLPKDSKILWNESQIKTRLYQTWNRKRNNRDADRMVIEKGSVIAVQLSEPINSNKIENGIGAHISEGFGKVLVNPSFLESDTAELNFPLALVKLEDWKSKDQYFTMESGIQDALVLNFLKKKKERVRQVFDIDKRVNEFVRQRAEDFKGISASQWGIVRNYAKFFTKEGDFEKMLFDTEIGYFYIGQSEKDWRKDNRRGHLETEISSMPRTFRVPFTIKLAAQMAKQKSKS
jgi:hypothetical protein